MFKVPGELSFGLALKTFRPLSYSEQLQVWGLCPHIQCSLQALFSYFCHCFLSSYLFLSFRSLTDVLMILQLNNFIASSVMTSHICSDAAKNQRCQCHHVSWLGYIFNSVMHFFFLAPYIYNPSHVNENVYFNLIYPRNTVQTVFWLMHVQMGSALCREQCFLLAALPYTPLFFSILHMIDWNWNMSQTSAWELSNRSSSDIQ